MEIPKRGKLADVFKKVFPGINREPVAPHKGLSWPLRLTAATVLGTSACVITDLIANKSVELSTQELQQATSLATEFTRYLSQDAKPQFDQAGFVDPTFQVGVVKQDGELNIQRHLAGDNILFMVPVTDAHGKSGIILRNLSAPFDPLISLSPSRGVDLVTLYQSSNGADLIGLSEEEEVVFKVPNAWADNQINPNAIIEVMTVDSTGMKDGGFAQLRIENPNSPSAVINTQINPDNPNEVLGQVDQDQGGGRFQKVIPLTPEGLPISPISLSINPVSATPKPTEKPTETPTPIVIATPTEVPLPQEFLAQAQEHGFPYKVVEGKVMVDLIDGRSVAVNPKQVADWSIWENNYLVVKGDNGIPQLRYIEGKRWESVEQTSMLDAYGNTVPGWVVETSPVWDGEPTPVMKDGKVVNLDEIVSASSNGDLCGSSTAANVKQWKLLEFMTADGNKMQSLQIDFVFNNGKQIITVRSQTRDVDGFLAPSRGTTVKQLMDLIAPGERISFSVQWGDPSSFISPQDLAKDFFGYFNGESRPAWFDIDNNPCVTQLSCAMNIGQVGAKKFPLTYLREVLSGQYGEIIDLSEDTVIISLRPR